MDDSRSSHLSRSSKNLLLKPSRSERICKAGFLVRLDFDLFCAYNKQVYEWDKAKREANLKKHGLDFADAFLVYEHPDKITIRSDRKNETRMQDIAIVETAEGTLSLAYAARGESVRVISLRRASRRERRIYARIKSQQSN